MKEALPLSAPTDESDDPRDDDAEQMKGGLPATATGGSDEHSAGRSGEEPKA